MEDRRLLSVCDFSRAADNSLNNGANYAYFAAPNNDDSVVFTATAQSNVVNNVAGLSLSGVQFSASVTLGGSPLAISGPIAADNGVAGTLAANITTGIVQIGSTAQPNYGTVVLSGTNTYSGGTWVQSGTLVAANPQAIGLDVVVGDQTPFTSGPPPAGAPTFARGMLWSYRCGDQPMDVSPAGVVYATGSATESADDLGLSEPTRLYSTNLRSATAMGPGWMLAGQPYLQQVGNNVAVIFSPQEVYNFVQSGGAYTPEFGIRETLAAGPGGLLYFTRTDGTVFAFSPPNQLGDATGGSFVGEYAPDGSKTVVTEVDPAHFNQINQIQYFAAGSSVPYQTLNIAYDPDCGLGNANRVASLTLFGPDGTTIQRQVVYTYYASSSNSGGELQSAAEFAGASFVGMSYYRYSYGGLSLALTPQDVANAVGAGLDASDTLSALGAMSDNQLASYASASFTYNPIRMVKSATLVTVNGAHSYEYTYGGDLSFAPGTNWYTQWLTSVCEVRPDGSTLIVYCNGLGQTMLSDLASADFFTAPSMTPHQEADYVVSEAIKKVEGDMVKEGWTRAASSGADAGAYGKELARRVQEELKGKKLENGGTFMFNTGVNVDTKEVKALNVTNGVDQKYADIDIMWLEDGKALKVGNTVDPSKVIAYELKTSTQRSDAAINSLWRAQADKYKAIFGKGNNRLAMSRYGMSAKGKMVPNPNYSGVLKCFSVLGMAGGAYSMLTVDTAAANAAEKDLTKQLGLLRNASSTEKEDQARDVILAAKRYLDVATGENISTTTSMVQWKLFLDSVERQYGKK